MIRFKKPKNELEGQQKVIKTPRPSVPADMCVLCPSCRKTLFNGDLLANASVCTNCGYHFRMSARERLKLICDEGSFRETGETLRSKNCIDFPGYNQKLAKAAAESGEREGVVTGTAAVGGFPCAVFVMEPRFMMGSMGSGIGEKLTPLPSMPHCTLVVAKPKASISTPVLYQKYDSCGTRRHPDCAALSREMGGDLRRVAALCGNALEQAAAQSVPMIATMAEQLTKLRLRTQGYPISPDDEILIVDDQDQPVKRGESGHLVAAKRAPRLFCLAGKPHREAVN